MIEPKFSVGQPVLVYEPGKMLPWIDQVSGVIGYVERNGLINIPGIGKGRWLLPAGWVYELQDAVFAAEYCLRPIDDPDANSADESELAPPRQLTAQEN